MLEVKLGAFQLRIGSSDEKMKTPKKVYKLKVEQLGVPELMPGGFKVEADDLLQERIISVAQEGARCVVAGGEQSNWNEYCLKRVALESPEALEKIRQFIADNYPGRVTKLDAWLDQVLNPPGPTKVKPKTVEETHPYTWPCGGRSVRSIGTAATMSEGMLKGGVTCVGYHGKDKPNGCGKRFVWSDKEQKWVEERRQVRVTGKPNSVFSDLIQMKGNRS